MRGGECEKWVKSTKDNPKSTPHTSHITPQNYQSKGINMEEQIRLQKFLADNGIASRRKCEELILQGKVRVNGEQINALGTKIDPNKDIVEYNGKQIKNSKKEHTYILLNKPIDYVTTVKDQFDRKTVLDLVKTNKRLVPVGRLDMYTSGAIILTDDGDFVYKVTHPKHEIEKTYNVTVVGIITKEEVNKLQDGVDIGDFTTSKANVKILKTDEEKNISRLQITIHEGKNRQVRRMCEAIGKKVLSLHRSKIGNISVKDLKLGTWRYLRKSEIDNLLK